MELAGDGVLKESKQQLSTQSSASSIINYHLSTIHYQLSLINYQLSTMLNKKKVVFQEERLDSILSMLEKDDRILTHDLTKKFNTSVVTIRKDLTILENRGFLRRTHGGAIKTKKFYHGLALSEKEKINLEEKMRIVKKAAELVADGDTIILDSGSTTCLLAREIKDRKNLTVITNALNIASELVDTDIRIILIGGSLIKDGLTMVGPLANTMLRQISANMVFLGVDGIDFTVGLTTPDIQEAYTSQVMMSVAGDVVLLADASKFKRRSLGVIAKVKEIDIMVTTNDLDETEKRYCEEHKINVLEC